MKRLVLWRQVYQINFGNIHVSLTTICSEKLSYLYKFIDSQHTGTTIINEWTGVTVLCCLVMGTFYKNFFSLHVIQSIMTNLVFSAVCDGVTMAGLNCFITLQTHQGEACRKIGVVKSVKYRCEEAQGGNLILFHFKWLLSK